MRRPFLLVHCAVLLFGLGCGGVKKSPIDGLSEQEYETLQSVNEAQGNTIRGAQLAFGSFTPMLINNNKAQSTADSLRNSGCGQTLRPGDSSYTTTWNSLWEVSSAGCPIYLHESAFFNHDSGQWSMNRLITVKSTDLRTLNGLVTLSMSGNITTHVTGGGKSMVGTVNYSQFEMEKIGAVTAQIAFSQQSVGADGSGSLDFNLEAAGHKVVASIAWRSAGADAVYKVNGHETERKAFDDAFSSFELTEIMDRVLQMR
jgi:hypothetical protein